jgi:hypothetical protein
VPHRANWVLYVLHFHGGKPVDHDTGDTLGIFHSHRMPDIHQLDKLGRSPISALSILPFSGGALTSASPCTISTRAFGHDDRSGRADARKTARLTNQRAWREILSRLHAVGIPKREANALREAIWRARHGDSTNAQKRQPGA